MQNQLRRFVSRNLKQSNTIKSLTLTSARVQPYSSFNSQNDQKQNKMNTLYLLMGAATLGYTTKQYFSGKVEAESNVNDVEIDFAETLKEGEMKELKVGLGDEDKVLITRYQGKLHAVGNYCTHFGAPMSTGLLFDDKVVCPWHAAAFSVVTGALEGAPGNEGLPKFDVVERDGKHYVQVPFPLPRKVAQPLAKRDPNDKRRYVVIGGGPAGLLCAETLRQSNYTGELIVISAEDMLPYDRTLLTKVLPTGDASKFKLRTEEYLKGGDIDFKLGVRAEKLNTQEKWIQLSDGTKLNYDKLCVATGATPFRPRIPGIEFENVVVLRSHNDQETIKKRAETAKKVVILGGGFIGSESASALKMKYKDEQEVHLVYLEKTPLFRQVGEQIGSMIAAEHDKNGVKIHPLRKVVEIRGDNNHAKSVVLDDGTVLEADLVLVGAGVLPATKWLEGSGVKLDQWGGIVCDPYLQSSVKDVYAAGDNASYPYWLTGRQQRIEHYQTAQDQGSHAAFNMLGKMVPFGNVPFFWTRHYNKSLQYVGFAHEYDEIYIQGDVAANKFVAFFIKDNKILAVAGQQQSHAVLTFMEAMHQNQLPSAEDIKSGKETVETLQAKLRQNKGASRCRREHCCQKKPITTA